MTLGGKPLITVNKAGTNALTDEKSEPGHSEPSPRLAARTDLPHNPYFLSEEQASS